MWSAVTRTLSSVLSGGSRWFLLDAALAKCFRAGSLNKAIADQRSGRAAPLLLYFARLAALAVAEHYITERLLKPNEQELMAMAEDLLRWLTGHGAESTEARERLRGLQQLLQAATDAQRTTAQLGPATPRARQPSEPQQEECSICMDTLVEVSVKACGHKMCEGCAKGIIASQVQLACPFCRGKLEFERLQPGLPLLQPSYQPRPVPFSTLDVCPPPDFFPREVYCDGQLLIFE